jgi:hypothetical protein
MTQDFCAHVLVNSNEEKKKATTIREASVKRTGVFVWTDIGGAVLPRLFSHFPCVFCGDMKKRAGNMGNLAVGAVSSPDSQSTAENRVKDL